MKSITRKILSVLLTVLMLGQSLPATLSFASAEEVFYSAALDSGTYHTVRFLDEDGSTVLAAQLVASGSAPVEPQVPTKENYEFDRWNPAVGVITADTDYTAVYAPLEKVTVTVQYLKQGTGETAAPSTVVQLKKKGADTTVVTSPDVVGYAPQQASVTLTATDGIVTASDGLSVAGDVVTVYYDVATASYKVRYLFEKLDGSGYEANAAYPDSAPRSAAVNQLVEPTVADYQPIPGFVTPSDVAGVVKADNSTVLELKYTRKSGTIVFDVNGGGTLVDAITAKFGETVAAPTAPTRVGYTFLGWYKEAAGTTQVTFPMVMNEENGTLDRTLYAKWQGNTVNYTVIYWVEKPGVSETPDINDPTKYNFKSQETRQATAGSAVSERSTDRNTTFTAAQINSATGTNSDVTVVTYQDSKPIASVNGDGTSVLNVYFKRIVFNWTFDAGSDTDGFYFMSNTGTRYTNAQYQISVKYEQNISDIWPSSYNATFQTYQNLGTRKNPNWQWVDRDGSTYSGFESWNDIFVSHRWTVTPQLLPSSGTNITFSANYSSTRNVTVNYWVGVIDGEDRPSGYPTTNADKTRDQVNYWKHYASQDLILGIGNTLSPKQLEGFTNVANDGTGSTLSTYNFYYARNKYTFAYNPQTSAYSGGGDDSVPYEKSLKLVFPTHTSDWAGRTIVVDGVTKVFGGWYYEPECQTPVDFASDRMPAKPLTIYAKWVKQQVKLSFDAASAGQAFADRDYYVGDVVENLPDLADKPYEEFTGWYSDAAATQKFTDGMIISRNTTLYAGWKPIATQYTVRYVDQSNNPISAAKLVAGVNAGATVTAGDTGSETEQPIYISGYTFDSVTPASLTLSKDKSSNTIVFKYKAFAGYHYTVKYLLEGGAPIPGVSDVSKDTTNARVVEYYKPITDYYPLTYIEKLELSASNQAANVIIFYYRAYQKTMITVKHYTENPDGSFTLIETDDPIGVRVGNTFTATEKSFVGYEYDHAVESKSYTVETSSPSTKTIELYYCYPRVAYTVNYYKGSISLANLLGSDGDVGKLGDPIPYTDGKYLNLAPGYSQPGAVTGATIIGPVAASNVMNVVYPAIPYTVTYQWSAGNELPAGVTLPAPQTNKHVGDAVDVASFQAVAGYTFYGWTYEDDNSNNGSDPSSWAPGSMQTMPAANVMLTGEWRKNGAIVVTLADKNVTYNGTEQSLNEPSITGAPAGVTLADLHASWTGGAGTNAGNYPGTWASGDTQYTDPGTGKVYDVTYVGGTLTIEKKSAEFLGESGTRTYTGVEQELTGITPSGLLAGDTYSDLTYSAKGTNVGEYDGTFGGTVKITNAGGTDVTGNYDVTQTEGKLTITAANIAVTFTGETDTVTYNGSEQELTGITPSGLLTGHTYEGLTYSAKGTNAGEYTGVFAGDVKILDADGTDVTENYAVTKTQGKLTIEKKKVTITATDKTYWYNAMVQGPQGATFTSGIDQQAVWTVLEGTDALTSLAIAGGRKNAGTYADELAPSAAQIMDGTEDVTDNYDLTYAEGDLTITENPVTINYQAEVGGNVDLTTETIASVTGTATGSTATPDIGYRFTGWTSSVEGDLTELGNAMIDPQKNALNMYFDVTYTAQFEPIEYELSFAYVDADGNPIAELPDGLTPPSPQNYTVVNPATVPALPAPTGWIVTGWNTQNDLTGDSYDADALYAAMPEGGSSVLYARLERETFTVRIVKNWNYGDGDTTNSPTYDSVHVTLLAGGEAVGDATLNNDNSWSAAWYDQYMYTVNGDEIQYTAFETPIIGYDTTYGSFTGQDGLTLTVTNALHYFTVTFVNFDGTVLKTEKVPYNGSTTTPVDPARTGYTFNGWTGGVWENVTSDQIIRTVFTLIETRTTEIIELGIPLAGGTVTNVGDSFD